MGMGDGAAHNRSWRTPRAVCLGTRLVAQFCGCGLGTSKCLGNHLPVVAVLCSPKPQPKTVSRGFIFLGVVVLMLERRLVIADEWS